MTLQCRNNLNGLSIQTTSTTATLTDLLMQTGISTPSLQSRYIRLEARSAFTQCGVPEFQIGPLSNATLFVGDNYIYTPRPFVVGTQSTANTTPSNTFTINGTLACSGRMTGKMFFCAGKLNADGTKAFTSSSGLTDFTCSISSNVFQITFGPSPTSANYVIQITGQGAVATVSSSVAPTATGFQVVLYSTSAAWATPVAQPSSFTVLH